ncbi:MAG: winged helix-turn-helix transcriptional regulator [Actinomycetota bacterium]
MRSYGQYCGLARALDVIGERWALLIVRELLEGPRGYNELLAGLPGIATNLLAERLRGLEAQAVAYRTEGGRYALTAWGQGLHEVVYALGRWAGPLMAVPRGEDHFRPNWLRHMVIARFEGADPRRRDVTIQLCCEGETMTLVSAGGRVHLIPGPVAEPDVSLTGPVDAVVGLLLARIGRAGATARGVRSAGDLRKLRGLRPRGEQPEVVPGSEVPIGGPQVRGR